MCITAGGRNYPTKDLHSRIINGERRACVMTILPSSHRHRTERHHAWKTIESKPGYSIRLNNVVVVIELALEWLLLRRFCSGAEISRFSGSAPANNWNPGTIRSPATRLTIARVPSIQIGFHGQHIVAIVSVDFSSVRSRHIRPRSTRTTPDFFIQYASYPC